MTPQPRGTLPRALDVVRPMLSIALKDAGGARIAVRARVALTPESGRDKPWVASVPADGVSDVRFDTPPGRYVVEVDAVGRKPCRDAVTVARQGITYKDVFLRAADEFDRSKEGEKSLVDARFRAFVELRSPESLRKRDPVEFPSEARTQALEHVRRMSGLEGTDIEGLVSRIDDPLPNSSFGSAGAFVEVYADEQRLPMTLAIRYDRRLVRDLDARTLRIFRIDHKEVRFTLVPGSVPDLAAAVVRAEIDVPGIYGLYGLPTSKPARKAIDLFGTFHEELFAEQAAGVNELRVRICALTVCRRQDAEAELCRLCREIHLGPDGLPEGQIEPGGPVVTPGCNWTCIGPRNINGRVRSLAIHPSNGNILVAGTATGGVWLTTDAGQSWAPMMRDEASLAIGAVAAHLTDPANPAGPLTIYAGTGEPTSWPGYSGVGVLKSIDSGATWTSAGALPAPGNRGFASIVVDPASVTANPATTVLYAAGNAGGLYRSANGGSTWTLLRSGTIQGVVLDPAVPGGLYAAIGSQGIFRYDPSAGGTWSAFNAGLPAGFPLLVLIAIGKTAPHRKYAKLDETVYRYDEVAATWTSLGTHGGTTYGYWNNVLEVDPLDSNIAIAGGIALERTFDGGTTWQSIGGLHSDQHAVAFDSTNHLHMYAGNDGGVYRGEYSSTSAIGAWTKRSDGLVVTEFNDVGTSLGAFDVVGGGTQDNGTSRTTGGLTWDPILGADGGFFVVDPANPLVQYAESQSGGLAKSTDGGASFFGSATGFPGGPWVTPIVLDPGSPAEPNRVLFAGGTSAVYRTTNSAASWAPSSPATGGEVLAIAIAPSSSAIVYAGSSGGRIWRSSDNGATLGNWVDITSGTVAGSVTLPGRAITDVAVHPTNPNTVFIAISGFASSTPGTPGHVFRGASVDAGATWLWTDITSTLPDIPANAVDVLPSDPSTLFVGTDAGVFRTTTAGASWSSFANGLPNVIVSDLAIDDAGTLMRASTYGRGMWQIRLGSTCPGQDVYVRDSKLDTGEASPSPSGVPDPTVPGGIVWWWTSPDVKVDAYPYFAVDALFDGVEFDLATAEDVVRNDAGHPNPNRLYVQVHNRGPLPAHNVKVKVLYADASAGLPLLPADFWASFPNDWSAASGWNRVDPLVPFQQVPTLLPHTPKVLRWDWVVPPSANQHTCMFVVVSADEDPVVRSDAVPADRQLWEVVPKDKHVGLRNLHVITGAAPPGGSPPPYTATVSLHNPFAHHQFFDLEIDRAGVGSDAHVAVLLPEFVARSKPRGAGSHGATVSKIGARSRWAGVGKGGGRGKLVYAADIDPPEKDPCGRTPTLGGLLIGPEEALEVVVAVQLSAKAKPGDTGQLTVVQRVGQTVIGGSTFEVRVPPAVVIGAQAG